MIKKSFFVLAVAVAMLFASCEKYDHAISDIEDRLDKIEGTSLTTIDQQITAINSSIDDLKGVDAELKGYIESLQTTADDLQSQIDATNAEIENVKKEMGDEIDAVEQSLLNKLDNLKTTLEGELATIKANIEALKAKDAELEGKITTLETYVNNQLQATEDWVNATFATLAQYQEVLATIAGIKSDISAINTAMADLETRINNKIATDIKAAIDALRAELGADYAAKIEAATNAVTSAYTDAIATAKTEIETAYTKDIADAIAASEISMKAWVNGKLQEVYTEIADVQADLAALAASVATDEELAAAVTAQQDALKQAKSELTTNYEAAIKKAIEDNNGIVNNAIAAITTATNNLQSEINSINSEITDIKERLDELKDKVDNLIARIQSIRFLPEYSDGKVEFTPTNLTAELTFLISPSDLAKKIATAYDNNTCEVTAYLSRTQERTRAVDMPTPITVTAVAGTEEGVLTVKVNVPANYWATPENANLFIRISDGNNDVISEMIPTFYTVICELPSVSTFRTAVHNLMTDGTKAIKFIANSKVVTEYQIGTSPAYMQLNGTTLEIHTAAKEFIFNSSCANMFSTINNLHPKFANITTIDFNGCINTSKVTSMAQMFQDCKALESLDLSSFNTANVTNMYGMFYTCMALESLDLSSFNTANVTDMSSMFYYCEALNSLDLSRFNTANVTDMSYMFYNCSALTSLDLSSFNTANVTDMSSMFNRCSQLTSLDLSNFNTANVTDMSSMFYDCSALTSLDLSSFNTANVTSMGYMFYNCSALTSLDLSNFNTAKVTFMRNLFCYCKALTSLDIRNFNIDNVTNIDYPFYMVGEEYNKTTDNKTSIMVTSTLKDALTGKYVSVGDYAKYFIVDNMPS